MNISTRPKTLQEKANLLFFQFKQLAMTDPAIISNEQIKWAEGDFMLKNKRDTLTIKSLSRYADYVCLEMIKAEGPDALYEFLLLNGVGKNYVIPQDVKICGLGCLCALLEALEPSLPHRTHCNAIRLTIENFIVGRY
jgi:hypothetical protein